MANQDVPMDGVDVLAQQCEKLAITAEIESSTVNLDDGVALSMPFVTAAGGYLVGSLLQKRSFSAKAMERLMLDKLWHPLYEVQMQEADQNLFVFGFAHRMDLKKVIREGPWRFNKHFLLLQEIEDPVMATRAVPTKLPIWVQITGVPAMWLTIPAAQEIGKKLGEVIEVDSDSAGIRGLGFLRVRVAIEAHAPLPRGLSVARGKASIPVEFLYERLENYCYRCGFLDHIEEDCPKTYEEQKDPNDIGWAKVMSAVPPVKKATRQVNTGTPSSAYFRAFGSVSPIDRIPRQHFGRSPALHFDPGHNDSNYPSRNRKRPPPPGLLTAPDHAGKELPRVPGTSIAELPDKRPKGVDGIVPMDEQVGEDAHPTE